MRAAVFKKRSLTLIFIACIPFVSSCAIFSSDEDPDKKNPDVKYEKPQAPFEEISVAGADRVWQSHKTGNTIAYNSACGDQLKKESLSKLEDGILAGIDQVKVIHEDQSNVDGAPAVHTIATGVIEKIDVTVDLVTIKKGNCTYDLAYAAKKELFPLEKSQFTRFVERFHAP